MRAGLVTIAPLIGTLLHCVGVLNADTIGPDCESCYGATYSLTGSLLTSNATTETWRILYEINTTGYNRGGSTPVPDDYISAVAVKVSSSLVAVLNFSGPAGWTTPVEMNSGLNNSGCSGSGGGWICAETTATSTITDGTTYGWQFDVQMASGSFLGLGGIKTNYDPKNGILVSEDVNVKVPEPFDLPYLLGALGVTLGLRTLAQRPRPIFGRNRT